MRYFYIFILLILSKTIGFSQNISVNSVTTNTLNSSVSADIGILTVTGAATIQNTLTVTNNTTLQKDLTVKGWARLDSNLTVKRNTFLEQNLQVQG